MYFFRGFLSFFSSFGTVSSLKASESMVITSSSAAAEFSFFTSDDFVSYAFVSSLASTVISISLASGLKLSSFLKSANFFCRNSSNSLIWSAQSHPSCLFETFSCLLRRPPLSGKKLGTNIGVDRECRSLWIECGILRQYCKWPNWHHQFGDWVSRGKFERNLN